MESFDRFVDIMSLLVSENGCPWDRVQTHESLKPCMLEESYEVLDAIDKGDNAALCEELGDVLLQVVIQSLIAQKNGEFTLDDTINGVSEKMINRHPNIFRKENDGNEKDFDWEDIKKSEKGFKTRTDVIKNVAKAMPALVRGQKIIKKSVGKTECIDKTIDAAIKCLEEIKKENNSSDKSKMATIGNLLMLILNISNFFEINAEFSLTNALETYITKFEDFENVSSAVGKTFEDTRLEEEDIFLKFTQ